MTLDARARRAAQSFRDAVEEMNRSTPERSSFERFDRFRRRKQRNARLGATLVACVLAFAAIVFAISAFRRAEQPAVAPVNNGRIVFVRYDHRSGEPVAFSMDPDGTDASQMFFSGFMSGHSEWPHWSPDGKQVTVFCCDDGKSPQIVNPDTGSLREITPTDPGLEQHCGFAWSPDGRLLACSMFGHTNARQTGVWTIRSADGGGMRQITSNPGGEDNPGDFSPDGKQLVFLRKDRRGVATGMFVVGVDGSGLLRLTPSGMRLDGFGGSWSPTDNQILFAARTDPDHRRSIFAVNADGSGLHQLSIAGCGGAIRDPRSIDCFYPGWSPDGTRIVFTRATADGTQSNIAIVNADGSGLVQITNTGDADEADWGTHALVP